MRIDPRVLGVCLIFLACLDTSAQRFVKVFDTVAALVSANPNDVHTNAFVAGLTNVSIYTWSSTSTEPTNANLAVLKANNFSTGRWFLHPSGGGAGITNFFETIYVTNLTVLNTNTFITNFFFNNTYITNINQGAGGDSLWTNSVTDSGAIQPEPDANVFVPGEVHVGQSGEAGVIELFSTNGTYSSSLTVNPYGTLIVDGAGLTNLLSLTSQGTNALNIDIHGSIEVGYSAIYGYQPSYALAEVGYNTVVDGRNFFLESIDSDAFLADAWTEIVNETVSTNEALAYWDMNAITFQGAASITGRVESDSDSIVRLQGIFEGRGFGLEPTSPDGDAPYEFDTRITHTTGDIFAVYNNTVMAFNVAAVSGYTGAGTLFLSDDGTYKSAGGGGGGGNMFNTGANVIGNVPYATDTTPTNYSPAGGLTLGAGTNTTLNGQLIFGPGTTNVLYRSDTDLVYTNGSGTPYFHVVNGSGNQALLGLNAGGNAVFGSTSSSLYISNSAGAITLVGTALVPVSGAISLGSNSGSGGWPFLYMSDASETYFYGTGIGTANYERGTIKHDGTSWRFDSQANGTGAYEEIVFQKGGTNLLTIDGTGSATTISATGTLKLEANSSSEVRFRTGNTDRWQIDQNGQLGTIVDNTYNIGGTVASGVNSPANIFADTSLTTPKIYFDDGNGTTNVLYRSGTDLVYTNGGATVNIKVQNPSGSAFVETSGGLSYFKSSGNALILQNNAASLTYIAGALVPNSASVDQLGEDGSNNGWDQYWSADGGAINVVGTGLGTANYERGRIHHDGSSWKFESQAGGTGAYEEIDFRIGTTNYVQIDANETANFTGLLLRENGTLSRVKVGAAGTGPGGSGRALYID